MAKSNNADAFKIQEFIMRAIGAWPDGTPLTSLKASINLAILSGLSLTQFMEAYHDRKDLAKLSETLYFMVTVTCILIKFGYLIRQRQTMKHILDLLEEPVFLSYPESLDYLMVSKIRSSQILGKLFGCAILMTVILMAMSPIFMNQSLPFPFPYELGRWRFLMFAFQVIGEAACGLNNTMLDTFPACLMNIAIAQLEILAKKIDLVFEESGIGQLDERAEEEVSNQLRQCVAHHLAIIKLIESIDKLFSLSTFAQFVGSAIILCNTLFHCVLIPIGSAQFFTLGLYLVCILSELFIFCWFGNEVIWKSSATVDACYFAKWYNYGNRPRKYILIMMERSKRPLQVTAFKFSTLSLPAFIAVIRWSYSYLTLIIKMYKE